MRKIAYFITHFKHSIIKYFLLLLAHLIGMLLIIFVVLCNIYFPSSKYNENEVIDYHHPQKCVCVCVCVMFTSGLDIYSPYGI